MESFTYPLSDSHLFQVHGGPSKTTTFLSSAFSIHTHKKTPVGSKNKEKLASASTALVGSSMFSAMADVSIGGSIRCPVNTCSFAVRNVNELCRHLSFVHGVVASSEPPAQLGLVSGHVYQPSSITLPPLNVGSGLTSQSRWHQSASHSQAIRGPLPPLSSVSPPSAKDSVTVHASVGGDHSWFPDNHSSPSFLDPTTLTSNGNSSLHPNMPYPQSFSSVSTQQKVHAAPGGSFSFTAMPVNHSAQPSYLASVPDYAGHAHAASTFNGGPAVFAAPQSSQSPAPFGRNPVRTSLPRLDEMFGGGPHSSSMFLAPFDFRTGDYRGISGNSLTALSSQMPSLDKVNGLPRSSSADRFAQIEALTDDYPRKSSIDVARKGIGTFYFRYFSLIFDDL